MSGGKSGVHIGQDAPATFAANAFLAAKTDAGSTVTEADLATKNGALLYNTYDDLFIEINKIFQGTDYCDALGVAGGLAANAGSSADDIVVGSTAATASGMTMMSSTVAYYAFSDVNGSFPGAVLYTHSGDVLGFRTNGGTRVSIDGSGNTYPETDNSSSCGTGSKRWSHLYSMAATIYGNATLSTANPVLDMGNGTGASTIRFSVASGSQSPHLLIYDGSVASANLRWQHRTEATTRDYQILRYNASGTFQDTPLKIAFSDGAVSIAASGSKIGFFGATAAVKQTVTGSRGGNAALASLITALATLGLVTDSSS